MSTLFKAALKPAAAAIAMGLAGCGALGASDTPLHYAQVHPIKVVEAPQLIELSVRDELTADQRGRVDNFADAFLARATGDLTIAYPAGANAGRMVKEVALTLQEAGVPARRLIRGPYAPTPEADGVVLSFRAPTAEAPNCANLWGDTIETFSNDTPIWFGCSVQRNLAAMVADPADLAQPAPTTPASQPRRVVVLGKYELGENTASAPMRRTNTREAE